VANNLFLLLEKTIQRKIHEAFLALWIEARLSGARLSSYTFLETTRKAVIETAHAVGIQAELETWPPMVLCTSAMTLLDLTTGYATFAAGGIVAKPYAVLEIRRSNGDVVYNRSSNPEPCARGVDEEK